jgi:hypothetical protein
LHPPISPYVSTSDIQDALIALSLRVRQYATLTTVSREIVAIASGSHNSRGLVLAGHGVNSFLVPLLVSSDLWQVQGRVGPAEAA